MNLMQNLLPVTRSLVNAGQRAIVALAAGMIATGCTSTPKSASSSSSSSSPTAAETEANLAHSAGETAKVIAELDKKYVIGPTAAGEMDYRIDWQFEGPSRSPLKAIGVRGESVFTLDTQNFLTHLRLADGHRVWRVQVAEPVLDVISLNVVEDRVCLCAGSEMLIFDSVSGSQLDRWKLDKIAGTPLSEHGPYFVYGSRSGEVVWISKQMGFMWRAYAVGRSMVVPPVLKGSVIAAVGRGDSGAVVMVLDADNATQFWSKTLLDHVVSKPVIGDGLLYVAGQDQYLWAYDLASGRTQWSVLTTAPLTSSPTLVGDRLYQQIPGSGLTCFNAAPVDRPGGEQFWQSSQVTGSVILDRRDDLFAWDAPAKNLQLVEAKRGGLKKTLNLAQVDYLVVGGPTGKEIFAASKDGRVIHLSPRN